MTNRTIQSNLRCVIVGMGTLPLRCAEIVIENGHDLAAVISTDSKLSSWIRSKAIPVYSSTQEFLDNFQEPFEYLFSIVNEHILRKGILDLPLKATINYHDGPLPRYAGTHATSWALMNRERQHGITWHLANDVVDAGDILIQKCVAISDDETAHSLNTKCYQAAAAAFKELIGKLSSGHCRGQAQDLAKRTFFAKYDRTPNGGIIAWNSPSKEISALIRALDFGPHPNPLGSAKIVMGDSVLLVSEVDTPDVKAESSPGTINEIGKDYLRISTLDKEIILRHLLRLDGRPIAVAELVTRFGLQIGSKLPCLETEDRRRIEAGIDKTCRSETYWVSKLSALNPATLVFARTGSSNIAADYHELSFSIPTAFREFIDRSGGSQSAVVQVLAAFGGFLGRLNDTGQYDVGFFDATEHNEFAALYDVFAARVPFCFDVDTRQPFAHLLESTERELQAVRKHKVFGRDIYKRYPQLSRSTESNLMLDEYPVNVVLRSGRNDKLPKPGGDITLIIDEEGPQCTLLYDRSRIGFDDIDRLLGYLTSFLNGISAEPDRSLKHLPVMSEKERRKLLFDLNNCALEVQNDLCIHHLFEAQVLRTPDDPALVTADRRLSYRELDRLAGIVADRLRGLGVGPEILVAICLERSVELIVGILGILKAGGAYVPLDPAYPKARLDQILDDACAPFLLTQSSVSDKLGRMAATVILIDQASSFVEDSPSSVELVTVQANNLAYVIYTSGSTGRPKGVAIEHRNTVAFLTWATSVFSVEKLKGTVASTSVCFDLSIFEIFAPLSCGGTVLLVENILHLPSSQVSSEATLINTVPSAMVELLRMDGLPQSVSTVNLAGEPLKSFLVKRIYETGTVHEVFDLYGPTEDTTYSTYTLRKDGHATIGRPILNTQAYVLDRNMEPVPMGFPGELYLGGAGLARGYLNQPDLTAAGFLQNPFDPDPNARVYKTGDLVRYLPSLELEYIGRIDNQVKIRGFRIELGEIETVLLSDPSVEEALVVARDDGGRGKRLVAYVVGNRRTTISTTALREHIKNTLPDHMVPSAFVELDALPTMPNGKIDRKALPTPSYLHEEATADYVAAQNETESKLVRIWESLLRVSPIGIRDDFFDLGGDSLLSVSLFVEIENEFGVQLPLSALIGSPTVEKLAVELARGGVLTSWKYLVPIQIEGNRLPLFCIHAAGGNVLFYKDLANELGNDQPFYGVQARGVADKSETAHDRIEEMAAAYLKEILSFQPTGPYRLCGASFGGLVAFEAARQLVSTGKVVETLALFDTAAPAFFVPENQAHGTGRLRSILFRVKTIGNQIAEFENWRSRVGFIRLKIAKLNKRVRRKIAWRTNQFAIEYNKVTGRALPQSMMRNHAAIREARDNYMPGKFDGDLLLFRASEQPIANIDPYLGWGRFVHGNITATVVKGTHGALTEYPFATDLASKLKPFLEAHADSIGAIEKRRSCAA